MPRVPTITGFFVFAGLFGWFVPLLRLFDAFQPMITALSIMVAAVFVRLNRGMPTLEWKSLQPQERSQLTGRILDLAGEYGWIVAVNGFALAGLVTLTVIGKDDVKINWPEWLQHIISGVIGGILALGIARMAYVVWRDYDIVKLQKHLIDTLAAREANEFEAKSSTEKIASIREAGLRKISVPEPKAWGE